MQTQPAVRLEVRSASGNLLFIVTVTVMESTPDLVNQVKLDRDNGDPKLHELPKVSIKDKDDVLRHPTKPNSGNGEALMTDSQKRLLFRLLASQGIEGDKAHQHLKTMFQVNSLKEITKFEASRGIDKLIEEAKGGQPIHAAA